MHEQTFNEALADAIRARRKAWRDDERSVIAERQQVFDDATRERPDILVAPPDIYPVVIEVEWGEPAFADARRKLGRLVSGTPLPVRSTVAVGAPTEVRSWTNDQLRQRLAEPNGLELRYAVLSSSIQGGNTEVSLTDDDVAYWPDYPNYVIGTVDDLAVLCEYAAAPPTLVSDMASQVATSIHSLADYLYRNMPPEVSTSIANGLGQRQELQGLRMACCIWLTSLRLHNLLASNADALRDQGLRSIAELKTAGNGSITLGDLRIEWDKILSVNYGSIFNTARNALDDRIPDDVGSTTLSSLAGTAERITALRLGNRVDFAGELFPLLLDDREETAAHYTLPETAELLGQLAVGRISLEDWASELAVANLKVADLACGTGALLRSSYHGIRRLHESAGGESTHLHRTMMEQSITGLDINSLASHMTAAGLSTAEIATEYHTAHIAAVAVLGGSTGSLELLESEQITDITGQLARTATANVDQPTFIPVPHQSQDLIIQNPPYSRARGDRRMFDVTGITEPQRKRSVNRLTAIRNSLRDSGNEMPDGQAGLGADFSALAGKKLKMGGVFASVLPLTAAHAESWEGFRRTIEKEYRHITAIAFTVHDGAMLSADTYMDEMLLVATKRSHSDPDENPNIVCINLSEVPQSVAEAYWYAKWITSAQQSVANNGLIHEAGNRIGSWTEISPISAGFPWFAVGMQNHYLATVADELMRGYLYSAADRQSWGIDLSMVSLGQLVDVGPTHDLIGHPRDGDGRGAFTFDRITPDMHPVYPALWSANSRTQKRLLVSPTHDGEPATDDEDSLRQMLGQRSDLFISRTLRMTSQSLAAARTQEFAMGGRAWTTLQTNDDALKSALAIWFNSTLGLMLRTCYAQTTQPGRATMGVGAIAGFPVPNFAAQSPAGELARTTAQSRNTELLELDLQPISYAFRDVDRHRIDQIVLEMVGLGENQQAMAAVNTLRDQWCLEPAVHGGNNRIMKALGLA
ncbi:MAG: hypothetical protein OXE87_00735 [Chloroflexi bacterium]|nr:hypothetical protein [Chloroflexota bacterium]